MSKITLPLDGHLAVPFQELLNDPLLVLKKFPNVDTLVAHGPLDYFLTTVPFALTNTLKLRRRWHIKLEVQEDKLVWLPSDEHADDGCDGWISGEITDGGNGRSRVTLSAVMEHRLLNGVTSVLYRNAIRQAGYNFMLGFETNFRTPGFQNDVPVWTGE